MNALAPASFLAALGGCVLWGGLMFLWPMSQGIQAVFAVVVAIALVSAAVMAHGLVFGVRRQELEFTGTGFVLRQVTGLGTREIRRAYSSILRATHHGESWVRVGLQDELCWIDVRGFSFTEREWVRSELERCKTEGAPRMPPAELARLLTRPQST